VGFLILGLIAAAAILAIWLESRHYARLWVAGGRGDFHEQEAAVGSGPSWWIPGGPAVVPSRVVPPTPGLSAGNARTLEQEEEGDLAELRMQPTSAAVTPAAEHPSRQP
jgi:hypothetical protein